MPATAKRQDPCNRVRERLAVRAPAPTAPANKRLIDATFDAISPAVSNLYERWQDEKDYEDITDYAAPIVKLLPRGMKLVKMTNRPFGFVFTLAGNNYAIERSATRYAWKRTA